MIKQYAMPGSGRNFAKPHNYEGKIEKSRTQAYSIGTKIATIRSEENFNTKVIKGKTELKIIGYKGKNT